MQRPVAALARLVRAPRHLDEAVVEAQRVSDRVLPALLILTVVGKRLHDVVVDVVERDHAALGLLYGHGYERDVGVVGLGVRVGAARLEERGLRGRLRQVGERGRRHVLHAQTRVVRRAHAL